jgi:hypothetical protein
MADLSTISEKPLGRSHNKEVTHWIDKRSSGHGLPDALDEL